MAFNDLPVEMQAFDQWVAWRYEDTDGPKPTKVPYSVRTGQLASVTNPNTWASFAEAVEAAKSDWYAGIGFVLTEQDPYAFIDLDDTKGDQQAIDRQMRIYNEFNSYAERSPSGTGLHIILKGNLPSGRKRSGIEIYSNVRFMTMTGDIYRNEPVKDYNETLNLLWQQMGEGRKANLFYAGLEAAKLSDEQVLEMANTAANAEKFADLFYNGNWQKYYPSQSEADFALFDILAFYSENGQQTQRIFLTSKLAEREKSRAQYRINYMLNRCFDRMLPPVDIEGLRNQINELIEKNIAKESANITPIEEPEIKSELKPENDVYSVPPGLVGEIAQFIYAQAPRPVPEIALAGALGLVAGIVGRAYNVSGTGLNQYVLLLAPTGTGKEAIASGIDKLMGSVLRSVPASVDFIGPGEIASSQAIIKYMSKGPTSFVSIVGEFGIYLQQMAGVNAPPHLLGLRRFMLDAYNKSGEGQVLRPSIYSDAAKNTLAVQSPAFSLMGESTPEKFYEGLHEGMISEGLLPRFCVIEYRGKRPPFNKSHLKNKPSFEVIEKLSTVCAHSLMLNSQHKTINVKSTNEAKELFDNFDRQCDGNINNSEMEVKRQLWNRAHIKAMKLSALIAVGCNPYDPEINVQVAQWAINLVCTDVSNMLTKFEAGEIGINNEEHNQLTEISRVVSEYLKTPWSVLEKYKSGSMVLHSERIVPYSYLHKRLAQVSAFRKDRLGNSAALKRSLKTMIERGDLQEVSRATLAKDYSTSAVCYMVSNIRAFNL